MQSKQKKKQTTEKEGEPFNGSQNYPVLSFSVDIIRGIRLIIALLTLTTASTEYVRKNGIFIPPPPLPLFASVRLSGSPLSCVTYTLFIPPSIIA